MQEKRIHQIFVISVALKGGHALIEIFGGLALYLISFIVAFAQPDGAAIRIASACLPALARIAPALRGRKPAGRRRPTR